MYRSSGFISSISSSAMGMYAGCSSGRLMTNSAFSVGVLYVGYRSHGFTVGMYDCIAYQVRCIEAVVVMVGSNLHIILFQRIYNAVGESGCMALVVYSVNFNQHRFRCVSGVVSR